MSAFAKLTALALGVLTSAAAIASPASAAICRNGICADSRDNGRSVNVYLSSKLHPFTHFNVRRNGGQLEVLPGQVYIFDFRKGYNQYYSVQVCNRGGLLQKSSCSGWVRFYHGS